ncbi:MAG: TetR/AcrR family transcriptional regulator [Acidobacteria bacterium]|nr:TetR/AcrR family transcriptional regulator [Acidobacteriota bacterium]
MLKEKEMQKNSKKMMETEFKRNIILDAAWRIFGTKGFLSVTMQDIAEEAEYALGTIYKLFDSKESIIVELIKKKMVEITNVYNDLWDKNLEMDMIDFTKLMLAETYKLFRSDVKLFQLLSLDRWASDLNILQLLEKECSKEIEDVHKPIFDFFTKGLEAGYFRAVDPYKAHIYITGIATEFLWDNILNETDTTPEEYAEEVTKYILQGIGNIDYIKNLEG